MNEFLKLFPLDMWLAVVPTILIVVACYLAPFYMPAFVILKNKKPMQKRLLFLFIIPTIVYGVTALLLIFVLPIESFLTYIYPGLSAANLPRPTWMARSYEIILDQWFYLYALYSVIASIALTKYLHRRWEALVNAMA